MDISISLSPVLASFLGICAVVIVGMLVLLAGDVLRALR